MTSSIELFVARESLAEAQFLKGSLAFNELIHSLFGRIGWLGQPPSSSAFGKYASFEALCQDALGLKMQGQAKVAKGPWDTYTYAQIFIKKYEDLLPELFDFASKSKLEIQKFKDGFLGQMCVLMQYRNWASHDRISIEEVRTCLRTLLVLIEDFFKQSPFLDCSLADEALANLRSGLQNLEFPSPPPPVGLLLTTATTSLEVTRDEALMIQAYEQIRNLKVALFKTLTQAADPSSALHKSAVAHQSDVRGLLDIGTQVQNYFDINIKKMTKSFLVSAKSGTVDIHTALSPSNVKASLAYFPHLTSTELGLLSQIFLSPSTKNPTLFMVSKLDFTGASKALNAVYHVNCWDLVSQKIFEDAAACFHKLALAVDTSSTTQKSPFVLLPSTRHQGGPSTPHPQRIMCNVLQGPPGRLGGMDPSAPSIDQFRLPQTLIQNTVKRTYIFDSLDLDKQRRILLHGSRGSGKTTLALELCSSEEMKRRFPIQMFVSGATSAIFEAEILNLGYCLGIIASTPRLTSLNHSKKSDLLSQVASFFMSCDGWLMIVDDLDESSASVFSFFQEIGSTKGFSLFTSNQGKLFDNPLHGQLPSSNIFEMTAFTPQESLQCILQVAKGVLLPRLWKSFSQAEEQQFEAVFAQHPQLVQFLEDRLGNFPIVVSMFSTLFYPEAMKTLKGYGAPQTLSDPQRLDLVSAVIESVLQTYDMVKNPGPKTASYPKGLYEVFELTLEQIQSDLGHQPHLVDDVFSLLSVLSLLPSTRGKTHQNLFTSPENVAIFAAVDEEQRNKMMDFGGTIFLDPNRFQKALAVLVRYGLAPQDDDHVSIHGLFQESAMHFLAQHRLEAIPSAGSVLHAIFKARFVDRILSFSDAMIAALSPQDPGHSAVAQQTHPISIWSSQALKYLAACLQQPKLLTLFGQHFPSDSSAFQYSLLLFNQDSKGLSMMSTTQGELFSSAAHTWACLFASHSDAGLSKDMLRDPLAVRELFSKIKLHPQS